MRSNKLTVLCIACTLAVLLLSGIPNTNASIPPPSDVRYGPHVDEVEFDVITSPTERVLAIQAGSIEMDTSAFDTDHYDTLNADPDIDIYSTTRNGYGHITINCRDYPLNISGLRRAFAFAFDKTEVRTNIFDGYSIDHDSIVPRPNGFCIEDQFDWNYYTADAAIGNAILDDLGFTIDGGTGYRLAPNGSAFSIEIEYASSSPTISGGIAQIGVDALDALHIDASAIPADFNDYVARLDAHEEYDMVVYSQQFYDTDVEWLAYDYWSDYADVVYQNPCNFANSSYDFYRDQLLYGTTYESVYEAAAAMQKILHYNVPRLIVYENTYNYAYRNDIFTGQVGDLGRGIAGPWTMRNIRNIDETPGGSVPVGISQEFYSFNFFTTNMASAYAVYSNIYSSLYSYGPDLQPIPDLATNILVETHSDNGAVPTGHTRYTIDIVQNAKWSDGMPLTADDVAFSFDYYTTSAGLGNPYGIDLVNLVSADAPSLYQVVLEFDIESYWLFWKFAYDFIIPEHIFNDATGIGVSGWSSWSAPHTTSGPFYVSSYSYGNWYKISKNDFFYYSAPNPAPIITAAADIVYEVNTTGNVIEWEVSDDNPLTYVVMKDLDFVPYASGLWDGSNITVNIDGLTIGSYNFTLAVTDYSFNIVMDTVIVTVVEELTTTTNTGTGNPFGSDTMLLLISIGAVGTVIVVIIVIVKSKKS